MKLTLLYIENSFIKYNEKYFNGELVMPTFEITNSKRILGQMETKYDIFYKKRFIIRVSKYYDRTEKQYDETIIHEMIHQYISQKNIKDNGSHGRYFKFMCSVINKDGWNLQRTTNVNDWKLTEESKQKEERIKRNKVYNIGVFCRPNRDKQFIFRYADCCESRIKRILEYNKLEYKLYKTKDSIFDRFKNTQNRIGGILIDGNEIYEKYRIK